MTADIIAGSDPSELLKRCDTSDNATVGWIVIDVVLALLLCMKSLIYGCTRQFAQAACRHMRRVRFELTCCNTIVEVTC